MSHRFSFTVDVDVDRTEGKFASRDEIEGELRQWLEDANQGSVDGIGATDWSVT